MKRKYLNIFISLLACTSLSAHDTVYVSGAVEHSGLLDWKPVMYHSNSYLDLSVHYLNDSNNAHFHELRATTRLELTQWPLPGYESDFGGYGMSHLSVAAAFDWGEITVGDVYGQFGSGFILNLYEERSLGVDGALRGAKIQASPYKGINLTALGGKQRRYWSCYKDHAFGWNYGRDAALGADLELQVEQWSEAMQAHDVGLTIGGSWVSKYEADDEVQIATGSGVYRYNFPKWVGAADVRTELRVQDWDMLVEYARKANDPCVENGFSYDDGDALLVSAEYSRKGLSVLAQFKRSYNMSFRSERLRNGLAGRLNNMPAFAVQHTYALAGLNQYATQYTRGEMAFQAEVRYTCPRKTKFGGKYGTTLKISAAHIRGLAEDGAWRMDTGSEGEFYTDVNIELNKRISKSWWLNAMLMYQGYNQQIVEGKGGFIRSGIAVLDARVQVNNNVSMRGEVQYLYSPDHMGQWIFALYELSLYHHWTLSGEWMYNIGYAPDATNEHFYTAALTYTHGAHRAMLGYTKTQEGFHCAGGVCRYVPQQKGICVNYSFSW